MQLKKVKLPNGEIYDLADGGARTSIAALMSANLDDVKVNGVSVVSDNVAEINAIPNEIVTDFREIFAQDSQPIGAPGDIWLVPSEGGGGGGDITVTPITIDRNGTYTAPTGRAYSPVTVDVEIPDAPVYQEKTITPSETLQVAIPSTGYDALSKVTINAIPSDYVGSDITRQGSKTITPTKSVQTAVAADRYTTGAVTVAAIPSQYIVPTGNLSITTNGSHTVSQYETVTVNVSGDAPVLQSKTITPDENQHIVTADTAQVYTALSSVSVNAIPTTYVGSGVTRQAAKTVTPSKSSQTAVASGVYTTGAITVGAIPAEYIIPSGSQTKHTT